MYAETVAWWAIIMQTRVRRMYAEAELSVQICDIVRLRNDLLVEQLLRKRQYDVCMLNLNWAYKSLLIFMRDGHGHGHGHGHGQNDL